MHHKPFSSKQLVGYKTQTLKIANIETNIATITQNIEKNIDFKYGKLMFIFTYLLCIILSMIYATMHITLMLSISFQCFIMKSS